ncbi:MAG: HDOD domain-containing protein [Deltaproteobacteria bacterium]|nr:HDOD domain-containing protein [Deltaproteobacteria bacterium]
MTNIEEIRTIIKKVPMFSHSAMRLMEVTNDPNHSLMEVVRIVEADAVLTAQVLKVVNSAAFGLSGKVDEIKRAAALLGDKIIVGLAIGHSQSHIYNQELEGYGAEAGALWEHSLRTAIASRELAKFSGDKVSPGLAYTAGILHDIGKSIIAGFMGGKTDLLMKFADENSDKNFLDAEKEVVGVTHAEVGYELAKHWNFPLVFQTACLYHHNPSMAQAEDKHLAYVIHLGDILAMMGGSSTGADAMMYTMDSNYTDYLTVSSDELNNIMLNVIIEFEKTREMIFN